MQFTLIAIQINGQQLVLGTDMQEHSVERMVRGAVESSLSGQVRHEQRYRSFIAVGSAEGATQVWRMNCRGEVVSRQVGTV